LWAPHCSTTASVDSAKERSSTIPPEVFDATRVPREAARWAMTPRTAAPDAATIAVGIFAAAGAGAGAATGAGAGAGDENCGTFSPHPAKIKGADIIHNRSFAVIAFSLRP
jgi:hypothetical protein